ARARTRALAEHTYEHRMRTLLATILVHEQDRIAAARGVRSFGDARAQVHGSKPLADFLAGFPEDAPLTLDAIVRDVVGRTGPLADEEAIFLFLHQFQELYLSEALV
ncbi:MAG: glycosyltransferase, partial [Thermodesulfobacteriota bacterium]